jgi:hypothetical protein
VVARFDLAVALIKGKGIDVDIPRALALLKKASDDGSARATYDLAALVASGVGGKPGGDALALFRRAASEAIRRATAPPPCCSTKAAACPKARPLPLRTCCAQSQRTPA